MTEHENGEPENLTLRLLREIREDIGAFRGDAERRFDDLEGRMNRVEVAVAAVSTDLKLVKAAVVEDGDRQKTTEGRLNTFERRLARLEEHTGLV